MRFLVLTLACSVLFLPSILASPAQGQQDSASSRANDNPTVEGTVVSSTRSTLVVKSDDNRFHLFTYGDHATRPRSLAQGDRVRVVATPGEENGAQVASDVSVLNGKAEDSSAHGTQAAPVPPKVQEVENDIKRESRRWRLGVRAGAAFNPELFLFGVQSQMGPIFHPRVVFRPNAEFAFGEVTDLIALNLEAAYRFPASFQRKNWTPYLGAGPALIFIHQNYQQGRQIDFGNFDYETGFNVLVGVQSRRGTFIELKTSLYSGPAPRLRLIVGYNF